MIKHSNPFGCLSDDNKDEDDNEASTVESSLVSTTSDKISNIIGMNDNTFYISTNLDQHEQLPDSSPYCRTPVGRATSALEINNIIGPKLEENQQQQPPATPSRCALTQIFETVSVTVLVPFNALWRQIQPQEIICELGIELNINKSPSDISNPSDSSVGSSNRGNQNNPSFSSSNKGNRNCNNGEENDDPSDSSNSSWGNKNNRTSFNNKIINNNKEDIIHPCSSCLSMRFATNTGTSPSPSLGTSIGTLLALVPSLVPSLGTSFGTSLGFCSIV